MEPPGGILPSWRLVRMGVGFGLSPISPKPRDNSMRISCDDLYLKYVSPEFGYRGIPPETVAEAGGVVVETKLKMKKQKNSGLNIRFGNPSFRRLISGAIAGAVSRMAVASLETIRTHLMIGSSGNSTTEVFQTIMKTDGWRGLFCGNLVNVIRVEHRANL